MPITINGTGSITGISAGGLPDGVVTQPEIATGVAGTGPAFSAYSSTSTTLSNATFTKVIFDTEQFDTANCYNTSNSRFSPNVAGYYQINAGVSGGVFSAPSVNTPVVLYKNGSWYATGSGFYVIASANAYWSLSNVVYLNGTTDYVEIYIYQNSGTAQTTQATTNSIFSGAMIRSA